MSVPKPTIVVIPGAWHSPSHFDRLLAFFHEADHPTVSLALPSLNPETPKKIEVATDVAFIREKMLLPLLEDGKDIVLVMHSYGGVPGGAAAKELSKSERSSQGQRGGIIGMIFIAAILTGEGDSLLSLAGGQWPPWVVVNEETGYMDVSEPVGVFYADVPESIASEATAKLLPHSTNALMSPSPPPAWADPEFSGRRAYIRCSEDNAVPASLQDLMVEHSAVEWVIKKFDTSHSPFLSRTAELAECLVGLVEGFAREGSGEKKY